jgi:uncharacterized protein YidB (DUF937 family)
MGLLDVLNGMRNGPGGQRGSSSSSGGMSPITMAILALLAYKGIKHLSGGNQAPAPAGNQRLPGNNPMDANAQGGGGLGDLLKGGLGGLLAGGAAGSVLSGGLGGLLKQFQQNGQGDVANTWVGKGPNQDISQSDLAKSIGSEDIDALSRHTGLSRDELLSGLRRELPGAIDELTPEGRVPTPDEASRWV